MSRAQAVVVAIAAVCAGIVMLAFLGGQSKPRSRRLAPDFTLVDLDGGRFTLSSARGQAFIINFWATWCPPCVDEMPSLIALAERLSGRVAVIGISVDEDIEVVRGFVSQHRVPFKVLLDPSASSARRYGTVKYPETYLVDAGGRIVQQWIGPQNWTDPRIAAEISTLLAGQ